MKLLPVRAVVTAVIAASALLAAGANAAPLYSNAGTAAMGSPATFSDSFSSATAGTAVLSFDVLGTGSMDGDNGYIDVFGLTVNGTQLLQGAFNMSGGGDSKLFFAPVGTVWNTATNTCNGCSDYNYQGGTTHISLSIDLVAGSNTLAFNYDSPTFFNGSSRAGSQGAGDESWALANVSVTAATNAVPEPESYTLLFAGLGLAGLMSRRQRRKFE